MPKLTIGGIEKKIKDIEEFEVTILHLNGKDVSAVKQKGLRRYPYNKAAPSVKTVAKWKSDGFAQKVICMHSYLRQQHRLVPRCCGLT
jgi:hypothetical protein